ncbi:DUF1684 domain-containing protein [Herbiconiux sp. VKM Ac-2851]|uniref:DUF1684 domain-containing protein n=1 Tax=Herbiconiux sp. VKM Ac-2851 TaxID=2739025 RepID=UPI001565D1ED|nr:DUF1684 domain-containing protein [Herbiconiux sp. VKM Ac-2851]NQX36090.1 DUF1684 domain-containing protein [Herbiconiux sp. VKM Ac-2851]
MNARAVTALQTADWRMRVFGIYEEVRRLTAAGQVSDAHAFWRDERDGLFAAHPATPLLPEDRDGFSGLPVAPYDPAWRFEVTIDEPDADDPRPRSFEFATGTDGVVPFELLGIARIDGVGELDVWRLTSYGGGLFVPVKDALAGRPGGTYGGGRYLIDTIKGASLNSALAPGADQADGARPVLDFNFAYNPSCAYDPAWACPLAQPGNRVAVPIGVGESYGDAPLETGPAADALD